jgi:PAS domain S-box-containing protein
MDVSLLDCDAVSAIEQHLYQHFSTSPHYFLVKRDLVGCYTYINPSYKKKFDFLGIDLLGQTPHLTVYSRTDLEKLNHALSRVITHHEDVTTVQLREKAPNGEFWWVKWDFSAIKDEFGNVVEILCVGYDNTANYIHELKYFEYAQKVNSILNSITDGFYVVNHAWIITRVNKVFEQIVGLKSSELIGKNLWALFPDAEGYCFPEAYKKAMYEKETVRFEEYFAGRYFFTTVYPSPEGITVFFQDITEKKEQEKILKQQEIKLKAISNSTADVYMLLDRECRIVGFNKVAQKEFFDFYNIEIQEGLDFTQYLIKGTEESFQKNFAKALAGESISIELLIPYPDGTEKWKQFRYFPIYDEKGEITGVSFNTIDIDTIKKQQELLKKRNYILEEIAHIQSHELRRPVANILGIINIVNNSQDPCTEDIKLYLSHLQRAAEDLDQIIHHIVNMTYYDFVSDKGAENC